MAICTKCYWKEKGQLSGQGFTTFTCALCGKEEEHHNTNVPKFCHECSKRLNMCQRCGEELTEEDKERG